MGTQPRLLLRRDSSLVITFLAPSSHHCRMAVSRHCPQPTEGLDPQVGGWEGEMGSHEVVEEEVEKMEAVGEQDTEGVGQGMAADLVPIEALLRTGIGVSVL